MFFFTVSRHFLFQNETKIFYRYIFISMSWDGRRGMLRGQQKTGKSRINCVLPYAPLGAKRIIKFFSHKPSCKYGKYTFISELDNNGLHKNMIN